MDDTLSRTIADYFRDKKEVVAVYLFGSHARGQEQTTSDVDVGILFDDAVLPHAVKERDRYMVELSRLLRKDIHPVILNTAGEGLS
jgi:predicted nucleotidyltransferase